MNGECVEEYKVPSTPTSEYSGTSSKSEAESPDLPKEDHSYRLEDLAYTRSGDKGNTCNIGKIIGFL